MAGQYAAVVLASSLMYVYVAHLNTLDMGLTLFLFVALGAFLLAPARRRDAARQRAVDARGVGRHGRGGIDQGAGRPGAARVHTGAVHA